MSFSAGTLHTSSIVLDTCGAVLYTVLTSQSEVTLYAFILLSLLSAVLSFSSAFDIIHESSTTGNSPNFIYASIVAFLLPPAPANKCTFLDRFDCITLTVDVSTIAFVYLLDFVSIVGSIVTGYALSSPDSHSLSGS